MYIHFMTDVTEETYEINLEADFPKVFPVETCNPLPSAATPERGYGDAIPIARSDEGYYAKNRIPSEYMHEIVLQLQQDIEKSVIKMRAVCVEWEKSGSIFAYDKQILQYTENIAIKMRMDCAEWKKR